MSNSPSTDLFTRFSLEVNRKLTILYHTLITPNLLMMMMIMMLMIVVMMMICLLMCGTEGAETKRRA